MLRTVAELHPCPVPLRHGKVPVSPCAVLTLPVARLCTVLKTSLTAGLVPPTRSHVRSHILETPM